MNPTHPERELEGPLRAITQLNFAQSPGGLSRLAAQSEAIQEPEFLFRLWSVIWRRKGTLLSSAFAGLVAAILLCFLSIPLYRSRAALEIQDVNNDFLNARQLSPTSDTPGVNTAVDIQTQQRILQSEDLLGNVLKDLKAAGKLRPLEVDSLTLPFWRTLPYTPAEKDYRIRTLAAKNLAVRPLGQTKMLEILYSSRDPQFAADFVNTLVSEYINSGIESRGHIGDYLAKQLNETRLKLQASESALQAYAVRSGLLYATPLSGAPDKTNVSEDKLRQLQEALSSAQAAAATAQSRYEIAKTAAPETLADVLNDSLLRDLRAKLTDLSRQSAELSTIYTSKDERVQRVKAQIAPLQSAFDHERDSIMASIRHDFETSQMRVKLLQTNFSEQSKIVSEEANRSIEYNILKREVDSNRQIYNTMMDQVKQATIASAIRASNVRVIDAAKPPLLPYSPNIPLNGAAGILVGAIGGLVYVFLRQNRNSTLNAPGETRLWTNLPELGVIPSNAVAKSRKIGKAAVTSRTPSYVVAQFDSKSQKHRQLSSSTLRSDRQAAVIGEAFRNVLTSLMLRGEDGSRARCIVFVSGNQGEGKTTVVCNLGLAMAQIRQKVLLIDGDLRRPQLHSLFDLDNSYGLSSLLTETSFADIKEISLVQATAFPGLHVLTSGPPTMDPANLLYADQLQRFLAGVKRGYDAVLIDTPPSLPFADARIVARLCDAVVFVTRAGCTTKDEVVTLQERFAEDNTPVIGSILNAWDATKGSSSAYPLSYYAEQASY